MTWSTSHLGISTLMLYTFSTKSFRKELKSNPRLFFIISLGSIAADIDLILQSLVLNLPGWSIFDGLKEFFAGAHRVWSHTFFLPLLIFLLAGYIAKINIKSPNLERNLRLFAIMWFSHILFDLTFGPLALFYPLDDRFYNVFFGMELGLKGNLILPVTIVGFYSETFFSGPDTGSSSFFVNWTPDQRINFFRSETTRINIGNFWLHVGLFAYYLWVVIYPLLKAEKNSILSFDETKTPTNRFSNIRLSFIRIINTMDAIYLSTIKLVKKYYRKSNVGFTEFVLILLIIVSYYGGPKYGTEWEDARVEHDNYFVLSDGFKFFETKTFNVPANSNFEVVLAYDDQKLNIKVFGMIIERNLAISLTSAFDEVISEFDDGFINFSELIIQYRNLLNAFISLESIKDLNSTQKPIWEFESANDLTIISGLYSWDENLYFIRNSSFRLIWTFDRDNSYNNGIFLMILFSVALFVSLIKKSVKGKNSDLGN